MTAKEILNKVKAIFNAPVEAAAPATPAVPTEPVVPASKKYKLQDGSEIDVTQAGEVVAPGDSVSVGGVPAAEGELVLEDGSTLVLDANGVVKEVKPVEPVTTDLSNVPAGPTVEERLAKIEEALTRLTTPAVPTGLATEVQLQAATERIEKQDKVIEGLFELAEKLAETPTADPITLNGNKKEQFERTQAKEQKLEGIASAIQQMKKK
jgi:hypothetical protein